MADDRYFEFKTYYIITHNGILHNNKKCQITKIAHVTFFKI